MRATKTAGATSAGRQSSDFRRNRKRSLLFLFRAAIERLAEDVAKRRARIGGAVLSDGFFLFRDLERLYGDRELAAAAIVGVDARIDLLAHREAVGALFVAV